MLKINLYPGKRKKALFRGVAPKFDFRFSLGDRGTVLSIVFIIAVIVLMAISYLYKSYTIHQLDEEIQTAVADSLRYAESIRLINEIKDQEDWIRNRIDIISMVDQNRYLWSKLMAGINDVLSSLTWLTRLETISPFPNLVFRIEGITFSNIELANFMRRLENLHYIDEVRLISSKEHFIDKVPTMVFAIDCYCSKQSSGESRAGKGG
jgi:Tfp pilus assembly protein PilN